MTRLRRFSLPLLAAFLAVGLASLGCGKKGAGKVATEELRLRALAALYMRYFGQHGGQPPKDATEFKKFIQSLPAEQLDKMTQGEDIEKLFDSPRNAKPYVIRYGITQALGAPGKTGDGPPTAPVFAYESEPVDGKRMVGFLTGQPKLVSEEEFDELVPPNLRPR